ncbi:purine and uridine phosphorylase [Aspergillus eucalypticola CBS 122712]|uniref:Purine and uridine phosphorylase n=1 Tax=Aspergillus eucalypticola (strain CBS 122712 / IBT 29274) TaxID=1448314 RepID=A0A317V6K1_ASPEC|nr:purine and uridine phosphorylase [Aspergillus eucalypticola CBS 122712]PWY69973.1 purine and uridine phosphorylase [Aspergillus eucalypticola CBS 122712]
MPRSTEPKENLPPLHTYTIAYITSLPKEQTAMLATLDTIHNQHTPTPASDKNTYTLGSIPPHNIVLVCLPTMGTTSAASAMTSLLHTFPSIRFVLLVGVAGGVPSNGVRLGDVVVSVPVSGGYGGVVGWDMGKLVAGGKIAMQHAGGSLNRPGSKLLGAVNRLRSEYELYGVGVGRVLRDLEVRGGLSLGREFTRCEGLRDPVDFGDRDGEERRWWLWGVLGRMVWRLIGAVMVGVFGFGLRGVKIGVEAGRKERARGVIGEEKKGRKQVNVHYGLVASGNWAVRDAKARDALNKRFDGQLLCIENGGAAGVMNEIPSIVICGISDYADASANEDWQAYAATVAAAYAKELLMFLHPCVDDMEMLCRSRAGVENGKEYIGQIGSAPSRDHKCPVFSQGTPPQYSLQ